MIMYAVIAFLLAITGIYSVTSFYVVQRTREIGVRMSLGATRNTIMKMVLTQSCVMSGVGLLIGAPVAAGAYASDVACVVEHRSGAAVDVRAGDGAAGGAGRSGGIYTGLPRRKGGPDGRATA